uniref:DUF2793 domain-containing protein n=1 Tax=Chthonobacter rhizosphaerae TaxID=2735553 RepID=UPI002483D136
MSETANLKLPLLAADQAQKHVTHNEALEALDGLVQLSVASRTATAPPPAPAAGRRWLVPAGATGAFAGREGQVARYDGTAWAFDAPRDGWILVVEDEGRLLVRLGGDWRDLADFAWLSASGGSARARVNKAAPADTASLLFQTGWSGRAEIGLSGSDQLSVKVSPDGSAWTEALSVDGGTGRVSFALGAQRTQVDAFTANGVWVKPAWARTVTAVLIGGGAGGGSGRRGASATDRRGGGGGGAGGWASETWTADELPPTLTVEVGAGGAGGAAQTIDNRDGANGGSGGHTLIRTGDETLLTAERGSAGLAGAAVAGQGGWGGGGTLGGANAGGAPGAPAGGAGVEYSLGVGPGGGGGGGGVSAAGSVGGGGVGGRGYRAASAGSRVALGGAAGG